MRYGSAAIPYRPVRRSNETPGYGKYENKILEKLPNNFIRVHRSNIVSLDRIDKIDGNVLDVAGQIVKVSKT